MTPIAATSAGAWPLAREVWNSGAFGATVGGVVVALMIFVGFLIVRKLFTLVVMKRLLAWAASTSSPADERVIKALEGPIRFLPLSLGVFFALESLGLEKGLGAVARHLGRSLIVFNIFWGVHNVIDPLDFLFSRLRKQVSEALLDWLLRAIKVSVILVGATSILNLWGIDIAPLIAGLGLVGVAVALGAQDLFKNLIAGTLIIAEKRFQKGDWIRVDGVVEGVVEVIGFRSTTVRRFDKAPVFVPNAKLSDTAVVNFSNMTHRRIYWIIGVEYATTIAQLRRIREEIERYILTETAYAPPSEVSTFVRVDRFSESSIDLSLYCFTRTTNWLKWLAIKEELALKIKEIVEGAGSGFAFPSQTVYYQPIAGEAPEAFIPPGEAPARATRGRERSDALLASSTATAPPAPPRFAEGGD